MRDRKTLISTLKKNKLTIATAESCSGGYLSYLLTKTPGSSRVFKGGIVVYSLEAKAKFFKIPSSTLKKTEGVSKKIALLLAKRTRKLFRTNLGISIVGFAGPKTKKGVKVGTVFMGLADKKGVIIKKSIIKGSRDKVRKKASQEAIEMIYKKLTSDKK